MNTRLQRGLSRGARPRARFSGLLTIATAGLCVMAPGGAWAQTPTAATPGQSVPASPPPAAPAAEPAAAQPPPADSAAGQQADRAQPPPAAPRRPYPPPPPQPVPWPYEQAGWGERHQPSDRDLLVRPFSFTAGVGPGGFFGPGEEALAVSYTLLRLGFGLAPGLSFVLGFEGIGTGSENPATGLDSWLQQHIWSFGIQGHVMQHLYLRGAVGFGNVEERTDLGTFDGGNGVSLAGAVGVEVLQSSHVALGLEAAGSTTNYADERWHTLGLHLTLAFY